MYLNPIYIVQFFKIKILILEAMYCFSISIFSINKEFVLSKQNRVLGQC